MVAVDAQIERRARAAASVLGRLGPLRAAYLFGSHAEGRAHRWSDIDLAAFMVGVETWDIHRRARAMAQVMDEIGADVEAHLFPASALKNPQPGSFVDYVLQRGIRIQPPEDRGHE